MTKAENVIVAGIFFALFMSLYGFASTPAIGNSIINQISSGPPTLAGTVTFKNCSVLDFGCAGQNIATATSAIAVVLAYPFIFIFWLFNLIGLFTGFVVVALTGPQQGAAATPLILFFFSTMFVYVVFEAFRILRGNSTAGV